MILDRFQGLNLEAEAAKVRPERADQKKIKKGLAVATPGPTEYEPWQGGWGLPPNKGETTEEAPPFGGKHFVKVPYFISL